MEEATAPEPQGPRLHPAEHRGYRELYVSGRQLVNRWGRLAPALEGTRAGAALASTTEVVRELMGALEQVTPLYGLHLGLTADGFGARLADLRGALFDRAVDTGMVVRFAVLDVEHVATLLGQLAELARAREDGELERFDLRWEKVVRPQVKAVRKAAIALGENPGLVAAPIDDSPLTRAAHTAGWALGSIGEAIDGLAGRTRGSD